MYKLHLDAALDPSTIKKWGTANKSAMLRCKPMRHLFHDFSVMRHLSLNTLDGAEPIDIDAMYCVGPAGDVWQAPLAAIDGRYDVKDIDFGGWWTCVPKAGAAVEYYEVTNDDIAQYAYNGGVAFVLTKHGEEATIGWIDADEPDVFFVQKMNAGDFICRSRKDTAFVVPRRIFLNTYTITKTVKP